MTKQHHNTNTFATDLVAVYARQTGVNGRFDCKHLPMMPTSACDATRKAQPSKPFTPHSMGLAGHKGLARRVDRAQSNMNARSM